MLNFKFQRTTKTDVNAITEALKISGYDCEIHGENLKIKGVKSVFCNAESLVKIDDNVMTVEGKIMPAVGGMIMTVVSIIFVLVFLFTEIDDLDVLCGVIFCGLFGVAGLFACLVSFFLGKKILINELADVLTSVPSEK
jgi:hypothetical protein